MATYDPGVFFLVADAERPLTRTLGRALGRYRATVVVSTLGIFRELLTKRTGCTGLVIGPCMDRSLPQEVLSALSSNRNGVPVALVTDGTTSAHQFTDLELIAGASAMKELRQFIRRALVAEVCQNGQLTAFVVAQAERFHLTPREAEILAASIAGVDRTDFAAELGMSPNTQKRHVGSLLEKTLATNTDQLAARVLRQLASSLLRRDPATEGGPATESDASTTDEEEARLESAS